MSWPACHRRVCTFTVIAEAHFCLAKADGVFSLADAVELLELCLIDALDTVSGTRFETVRALAKKAAMARNNTHLSRKINLDGLDADV